MLLRLIAKMSDRFLEQRICLNLGKNASCIYVLLSDAYLGDAVKKFEVF
jgi:hypothetical protein